ncbi:hypothetical protein ACN28S_41160 [Cystobacter fuscus]
MGGDALASTINQNTSWTINRGATTTYRVVAYGDSIFAGYKGSLSSVAKRSGPQVQGEYLAREFNSNMEVFRRTKSGAKADDIYNNKIVSERSYMQASNTRVVMFEMCGNDYLQARSAFEDQTGTCSYSPLDTALANCTTYTEKAMQAINQYATTAKAKIVMNLYYPGFNADNKLTSCTDPATGKTINQRQKFLPYRPRATGARAAWRRSMASSARTPSPSTWAPTTTPTATGRSTARRCATSRARPRPPTSPASPARSRPPCVTPTRTSSTRAPATTTCSRTTRTPRSTAARSPWAPSAARPRAPAPRTSPTRR